MALTTLNRNDLRLEEVLEFARAQRAQATRLTDELLGYLHGRSQELSDESSHSFDAREHLN